MMYADAKAVLDTLAAEIRAREALLKEAEKAVSRHSALLGELRLQRYYVKRGLKEEMERITRDK